MKSLFLIALSIGLILASPFSSFAASSLRLSMLPHYSLDEIEKRVRPLAKYLSYTTGIQIEPIIVTDFKEYEQRLARDIDIGFENPLVYVRSPHQAVAVISKKPDGSKFRGLIITRTDSPIVAVNELVGKHIAIVSNTSAGGYLSQRISLLQEGIDTNKDMILEVALNNKQENVIFSTYNGDVDAGFIRESALHAADAFVPRSQIKVIKKTAYLPEWVISVRRDLPEKTKDAIRNALINLKRNDPILQALQIEAFEKVEDKNFNAIRRAVGVSVSSE